MLDWGQALRQLRQESGRSQGDVVARLGVSRSYLSVLEHGHKQPSVELLEKAARVYGVPVARLVLEALTLDGLNQLREDDQRAFRMLRYAVRDAYPAGGA